MNFTPFTQFISLVVLSCLLGCSITETVPRVAIKSNSSGIEVGKIVESGPSNLLGEGFSMDGEPVSPDIPSRITI